MNKFRNYVPLLLTLILIGRTSYSMDYSGRFDENDFSHALLLQLEEFNHNNQADSDHPATTQGGDAALALYLQKEEFNCNSAHSSYQEPTQCTDTKLALCLQEEEYTSPDQTNNSQPGSATASPLPGEKTSERKAILTQTNQSMAAKAAQARAQRPTRGRQSHRAVVRAHPARGHAAKRTPARPQPSRTNPRPVQPARSGTIVLPRGLANLNIAQLPSRRQGSAQCGYFAVLNAYAIQQLALNGQPITAAAIHSHSVFNNTNHPQMGNRSLWDNEIADFAARLGLQRALVIGYDAKGILNVVSHTRDVHANIEEFVENIQHFPNFHFIFNTGGHWVLISAVKENGTIRLYYLDSGNGAITPAQKFINFVVEIINKILPAV